MKSENYVYIAYAVSVQKLSSQEINRRYKKWLIDFPLEHDYEEFCHFYRDILKEPTDISINRTPVGYFVDKVSAVNFIINNTADFNDGGCYPYAMLEKLPLGCAYPESCEDVSCAFFKYELSDCKYVYINSNTEDINEIKNKYCLPFWKNIRMN